MRREERAEEGRRGGRRRKGGEEGGRREELAAAADDDEEAETKTTKPKNRAHASARVSRQRTNLGKRSCFHSAAPSPCSRGQQQQVTEVLSLSQPTGNRIHPR